MSNKRTDRNKLATIIAEKAGSVSVCWSDISKAGVFQSEAAERYVYEAVDAILAAGYRRPRTITTVEELDALPSGSVILDSSGEPNVLHDNGWVLPGGSGGYTTWAVAQSLPATVLHEAVTA